MAHIKAISSLGVLRGGQAKITHELSGPVKARQVTQFRDDRDGHGELHAPHGMKGLDHWLKPSGLHLPLEFLFETLQSFGVLVHRPHIFLEDNLLRRGRTHNLREPAQVGWSPRGPTCVANIVSEEESFETELGGFEISNDILTCSGEVA